VGGLLTIVGKRFSSANDLISKYDTSCHIVTAILSECATVRAYLTQIQTVIGRQTGQSHDQDELWQAVQL
jgi:hypothetical protein